MFSPILNHAIESFDHGLEHFIDGTPRSRKFAFLHIDHAIELLLKEKVSRLGKELYKSDGTTITFHESLKSLKDLKISEQSRLQEIHDTRNVIQHKGITPDENTTQFYIKEAYKFIKRFLLDELDIYTTDILSSEKLMIFEDVKKINLNQIRTILKNKENLLSNIINSYALLEQYIKSLNISVKGIRPRFKILAQSKMNKDFDKDEFNQYLDSIMRLRNMGLHQNIPITELEYKEYTKAIENIIEAIN